MFIKIKVRPLSGTQEVREIYENEFTVFLKSKADEGKANLELIKLIKSYFKNKGVIKDLKIIKGLRSRDKIIKVTDERIHNIRR